MSRRLPLAVAAGAVAAWLMAVLTDIPPHLHLTDLPVYESAAQRMAGGEVPYRDFGFEYPPLAAGLILVARLIPLAYGTAFSLLMAGCLVATALAAVAIARRLGMSRLRQAAAGGIVAATPLLLGDFLATRFDLAVAALVAWTIWAAVAERWRLAWGLLAVAVALKLAPVVLAPLLFAWHRSRRGSPAATGGLAASAAAALATFLPFVAVAPGGVWALFRYHLDRPLEIESLGGAYLLGLHALTGQPLRVETTFGSQNLIGTGPDVIAAISAAVLVAGVAAALVTVLVLMRRSPASAHPALVVTGMAATLAVTVGAGKVLSPQFLVWLLPAALLVGGRYGPHALGVVTAAMLFTQFYFPAHYWDLVALDTPRIALVVVRDALLVTLAALSWPRPVPGEATVAAPRAVTSPAR